MKSRLRNLLKELLRPGLPVLRLFLGIFFDRSMMRGRYFEQSFVGYRLLLTALWRQKILGFNRAAPWPMSPSTTVSNYKRLHFDPSDLNNLGSPGCYFQNFAADITLGSGTYIAPNVGIITSNHNPLDLDEHMPGLPVVIGPSCWIGMNSTIMPGVTLGPRTTVGAGSIVTKSFPEGHCIIAGNPARLLRRLPPA